MAGVGDPGVGGLPVWTSVLLPNKGQSWNFGISDWWGFRQLHTDMSGRQRHASGLWQEKEN